MVGSNTKSAAAPAPAAASAATAASAAAATAKGASEQEHSSAETQATLDRLLPEGHVPGVNGDADMDMTSSDYYFNSYAHFGIHEEMLKDEVRTRGYMRAICENPHLFAGKTVLDVGCGTGILSIFAAKARAAKVYAVECSKIVDQARRIIEENGFADVVEVIEGKIEDIELPSEVDIIISEWMGYFLFYESMLDTVLFARDKWLKKDGMLFPDRASLYLCGIEDAQYKTEKIDFWSSVYGVDMSCIKNVALTEPLVDTVDPEQVMTTVSSVFSVDMNTVKKEDLAFAVPFSISAIRNDYCHALVAFFDVEFSRCHKPVTFVTGPSNRPTHWKQTVLYIDTALPMDSGEMITGTLACRPNSKNPRDLDIAVEYDFNGTNARNSSMLRYRLR